MRLSTMTNLMYENREDGKGYLNSVRKTREYGFGVMDFCMCPMQRNQTELVLDNWESTVYEIANEAEKLGVVFSQSHLPYPKAAVRRKTAFDDGCEQNEFFQKMTFRAIEISKMLGVKWAVVHPVQDITTTEMYSKTDIAYNHFIYDKYVEAASRSGVGLAFENMCDVDGRRRFGVTGGELCELVESYNSDYVKICWDFGHANRTFYNQISQLKLIGEHLRATHVDDNIGKDDLHTFPYLGTVNWKDIMKTLVEINYEGDFNFELSVMRKMPLELKQAVMNLTYTIGNQLLSLAK